MATPNSPLTPDQRLALEQKARYDKLARNVAIGGCILCPAVALMPPRKLDLYTFALGIGFYLSADHLSTSYTNRSLVENLTPRWSLDGLPTDKARETKRLFEERRLQEGREKLREGREQEAKTWTQRVWYGDEKEGWKERRLDEERKALEEGKSYGSMILEQIWEVWNWDKKKNGSARDNSSNSTTESTKNEEKKS